MTVPELPWMSKEVDSKVISGNCSTEKKSSPRTWPSRSALPVLTEAVLMTALATETAGFSWSTTTEPSNSSKVPRTLVTMAWRATKAMSV